MVHAVFLQKGSASTCNLKYIILMKDDFISYTWLHPCDQAGIDAAPTAIAKCIKCLGCMKWLVMDQGSHFVASLMNRLTENAKMRHDFTTLYCPWANGTVK